MNNHTRKERRIEPWERARESSDQTPSQGEVQITSIVNLAGISIPSIGQNTIAGLGFDGAGVLDGLPRQLWECLAGDESTSFHGAEAVLLAVGCVPDPVHEEIGCEEGDEEVGRPAVR